MAGWTLAGLSSLASQFTVIAVQMLKPYIELIPGINLASNKQVHDNTLRILQVLINLGCTALFAIATPFYVGVPWWAIVLLGLGAQPVASEVTYSVASGGGSTTAQDTAMAPPTTIPTVPRA